ncbi:MAG: hypothetical protein ACTSUE_26390 [Promethearchaeota archaeon]
MAMEKECETKENNEKYSEAIDIWMKLVDLYACMFPTSKGYFILADTYSRIAVLYLELKDTKKAIAWSQKAVTLVMAPEYNCAKHSIKLEALEVNAAAHMEDKNFEDAKEVLDLLLKETQDLFGTRPNSVRNATQMRKTLFDLGIVHQHLGELETSQHYLQKVKEHNLHSKNNDLDAEIEEILLHLKLKVVSPL